MARQTCLSALLAHEDVSEGTVVDVASALFNVNEICNSAIDNALVPDSCAAEILR